MEKGIKMSEYVKQKEFDFGLPQGDTILEMATTDVEETVFTTNDGKEKPTWRITLANNETYNVPKSVMASIKNLQEKGACKVRITRTGTQLQTRYTVVQQA